MFSFSGLTVVFAAALIGVAASDAAYIGTPSPKAPVLPAIYDARAAIEADLALVPPMTEGWGRRRYTTPSAAALKPAGASLRAIMSRTLETLALDQQPTTGH